MEKALRLGIKIGFVLGMLLLPLASALAADITVDGTVDGTDCTLPDAIDNANRNRRAHSECAAGESGLDTITIAAGLQIDLSEELQITSSITINGNGAVIDAGRNETSFNAMPGTTTLTLNDLNVTGGQDTNGAAVTMWSGGSLVISGSQFYDNRASNSGGAIYIQGGSLTVTNSAFYNNRASNSGGAIYITGGAAAAITNTTISGNKAEIYAKGTGIHMVNSASSLALKHVTIINNSSDTQSTVYGLRVDEGTITIENSLFSGNENQDCSGSGNVSSATSSGNLIADGSCADAVLLSGSPDIRALSVDGVHTLQSSSAAIDAVACLAGITDDQMGNTRPQDGDGDGSSECDIGAYEAPPANGVITVDDAGDTVDDSDSLCTLREAIQNANAADRGNGNCERGGSNSNTINMSAAHTITLGSSLPIITKDLTINGNGSTVDGAGSHQIMRVRNGGDLTLDDITLQNGSVSGVAGGAILIDHADSSLTITDSVFTDNASSSTAGGAAVRMKGDVLTITDSAFSNNSSTNGIGGAISLADGAGSATISKTTFSGNTASGSGGAIHSDGYSLTIINSTFSGNTSNTGSGSGGSGIHLDGGSHSLKHVTIASNSGGSAGLVIVSGATVAMENSLLADNADADCSGTLSTNTGNLIEDGSCGGGDISGAPLLAALANGVHTLGNGSAAIDAAACLADVDDDQLGTARPQDYDGSSSSTECDAGAVEAQASVQPAGGVRLARAGFNLPVGGAAIDVLNNPGADGAADDGGGAAADDDGAAESDDDADDDGDSDDDDDDNGGARASNRAQAAPTAVPTATAIPKTCPPLAPKIVVSDVSGGTQCQQLDAGSVGNEAVIAAGLVDGVDVWSWVAPGTQVCFQAGGSGLVFLDAATAPRTLSGLSAYWVDELLCATIDKPGSVVVVGAVPVGLAGLEIAPQGLSTCTVTTTDILNLRDSINGVGIGMLMDGTTVPALEYKAGWYKVDYHDLHGWISGEYVTASGGCG